LKNVVEKEPLVQKSWMNTRLVSHSLKRDSVENVTLGVTLYNKILCVGGKGRSSVLEVYSSLNKFKSDYLNIKKLKYLSLLYNLSEHCVLKLHGVVYCIGGVIDGDWENPTDRVFQLDLTQNVWQWNLQKPMLEKRRLFGATVFGESLVVAGGWNGSSRLNSVEVYDVKRYEWRRISSMKCHRNGHALVAAGWSLYALGGWTERKNISFSVEKLDHIDANWTEVKSMIIPRTRFAAVQHNGFIYALGGQGELAAQTSEKYDPIVDQWSFIESMSIPREQRAAYVFENKIIVVGGLHISAKFKDIASLAYDYHGVIDTNNEEGEGVAYFILNPSKLW